MKRISTHFIMLLAFVFAWQCSMAQNYHLRHDTVYVYESWESIFDSEPEAMLVNPIIAPYTPYNIDFNVRDEDDNKTLHEETVALAIGDSIWYLNTHWLQENFNGECNKMDNWVPLYFSAKVAFVEWTNFGMSTGKTILGALLGDETLLYDDFETKQGDLYMLDFDEGTVYKIDHKRLSKLLEPYRDLKMRYESMKDYKKPYMIRTFFMEYINRLNDDFSVPFLI